MSEFAYIQIERVCMAKIVMTAEKPSVAMEYAKALSLVDSQKHDGYIEGHSSWDHNDYIVTWAIGHLITLSYPEKYDEKYKKWNIEDLPFLPTKYKYEGIPNVKKQFKVIVSLYNRKDIDGILLAGDSGVEGYYIQQLIITAAKYNSNAWVKVVWIDSQTQEEIRKGVRFAKPTTDPFFLNLKDEGFMRAIEDYSMGINFSRALSCKYGKEFNDKIKSTKYVPISVGRVMTCVLGMITERERTIKAFKPTDFWKITANVKGYLAEWKATEESSLFNHPEIYQNMGFYKEEKANGFIEWLTNKDNRLLVEEVEEKIEKQQPPLLFNLAELQSECSKQFKISPDETLKIAQSLYEKKLTTYPRTDARVLTTAIAKEIHNNLTGLAKGEYRQSEINTVLSNKWYENLANKKYVDDKKVTDHYAIIPTGIVNTDKLSELELSVYRLIIDRFIAIFYPAAEYKKTSIVFYHVNKERFYLNGKILISKGFLAVYGEIKEDVSVPNIKKGEYYSCDLNTKQSATVAPKHFTSSSLILAMENAGNYIDEENTENLEELKAQLKGTGIGTSATRAEIIKKLVDIKYIGLTKKTQIYSTTPIGEAVYDIVKATIPSLLNPKMTASWQIGLSQIAQGKITKEQFKTKLYDFITQKVNTVKST